MPIYGITVVSSLIILVPLQTGECNFDKFGLGFDFCIPAYEEVGLRVTNFIFHLVRTKTVHSPPDHVYLKINYIISAT